MMGVGLVLLFLAVLGLLSWLIDWYVTRGR